MRELDLHLDINIWCLLRIPLPSGRVFISAGITHVTFKSKERYFNQMVIENARLKCKSWLARLSGSKPLLKKGKMLEF